MQFMRAAKWTPSNCGSIWFQMHQPNAPFAENFNYPNFAGHYATGSDNKTITPLTGWLLMALALADDDPRAVELLADTSAYFYDQTLSLTKQLQTGVSWTNPDYFNDRNLFFTALAAVALRNGVVNGPDYVSTDHYSWLRTMPQAYMLTLPGQPAVPGGKWGAPSTFAWDILHSQWMGLLTYMYPTSDEAKYFTWWFRDPSARNAYSSSFSWNAANSYAVPPNWIFSDPNQTQSSLANGPTQYLFRGTDQAECAYYRFNCTPSYYVGAWASRSSNTAAAGTLLFVDAQGFWAGDHAGPKESGEYQISKNGIYLLGGNSSANNCDSSCNHGGQDTTTIEFGDQSTWLDQNGTSFFVSTIPRWSGTDPTGDSQNRYSYGLVDVRGQYKPTANITRALRHIVHFKKAGTPEFIIAYDDLATSSGLAKATYLHFNLNNPWPARPNPYPGGVIRSGAAITSSQSNAWLGTTLLTPSGQTNFVNEASWAGPDAYGVKVCAASTISPTTCDPGNLAAEWIAVHKLATSTASMPPLTQPTAANFRVVQANDPAGAKVAAFGTSGGTFTSAVFTTTHGGIAQYLIAGLSPGTYTVALNGTALLSNQNVASGDNTLYFESASGAISITQSGAAPGPIQCDLNGDGLVNILDVQAAINAAMGLTACTATFDLNKDGVCNVIDIQRAIGAAIGLGCTIGL